MKKILTILLTLAIASTVFAQSKDQKVTFYVNYHCEQCIKKINKNIPFEKGVKNLKANLDDKSLVITYNPKQTTPEELRKAVEKLDFVVKDSYDEIQKHQAKH
ncbi:MAG: heavy-metal-associated domain-containing protein [Bacteroidales bacterium]|jgi:copper chaperone CopZ|nr:heavy-metal-associated domain-containing protein [Bacteroidales bacterium]